MSKVETVTIATNELERLTSQAAKYRIEAEGLRTRLATLGKERDDLRDLAASEFARLCKMAARKEELEARVAQLSETIGAADKATVRLLVEKVERKKRIATLEAERDEARDIALAAESRGEAKMLSEAWGRDLPEPDGET